MSVYIFLYLVILLLTFISYKKKYISLDLTMLLFLSFFLISAMRYYVGRDYKTYVEIFKYPEVVKTNELGFMLINKYLKIAGFSFQSVCFLFSFFTLFFAFLFIKKRSEHFLLSLLFFYCLTPFYFQTFNTMRQGLVIYGFFFSITFIEKRKFFIFSILLLFFAFFAHISAFILFPLFFFIHKEMKVGTRLFLIGLIVLLGLFCIPIIELTPYKIYLTFDSIDALFTPIQYFFLFATGFAFFFSLGDKEKRNCIMKNVNMIAFALNLVCLFIQQTPLFILIYRLTEYFTPVIIVLIPNIFFYQKNKMIKILLYYCAIGLASSIFLMSMILNGVSNELVPYKTFFSKF